MSKNEICQSSKNTIKQKIVIAAFDFDKTITDSDSLPYFFCFTKGYFQTLFNLFLHIPKFIFCLLNFISRQSVKISLITNFFKGMPISELLEEGKKFAEGPLKKHLKQEALEKIKWHQDMGHMCILVSANLNVYLDVFAKEYGFKHCICTKVEFNDEGYVTGGINGKNCWGPEKVARLKELLGDRENYLIYAYGDSLGDKELLEFADYPFYRLF